MLKNIAGIVHLQYELVGVNKGMKEKAGSERNLIPLEADPFRGGMFTYRTSRGRWNEIILVSALVSRAQVTKGTTFRIEEDNFCRVEGDDNKAENPFHVRVLKIRRCSRQQGKNMVGGAVLFLLWL